MSWVLKSASAALLATIALGATAFGQDGIQVRQLGSVHPLEVELDGDLPTQVWSSGRAPALSGALQALPDSQGAGWDHEPSARLALQALLSGGRPPSDGDDGFELAVLRADRALAAGRAQHAYELLSRTPEINRSPALSRLYAETAFALGHLNEACRASAALLSERDTPYWLRARAACLAFDGNIPAGELTSELARATAPDRAFDIIFDAYTLGADLPANGRPQNGLQLAIAAELAPGERIAVAETAPAWLKRAAERTGPSIKLPETLPEALEAAVQMQGSDRAAALGILIQQDYDRVIAAEALAIRLEDARQAGDFLAVADAYGGEVADLPMTADTLANGMIFILAALGADDVVAAQTWRNGLMEGPPKPPAPETSQMVISTPEGLVTLNAPPEYANPVEDETAWTPPSPGELVAVDFARKVAMGDIRTSAFAALLAARIENASPSRLCQAAALIGLGAMEDGSLRAAMIGTGREADAPAPMLGPVLLAGSARAIGETQLLAASVLNAHPNDPEACAAAAIALDKAGLRVSALRFVLEHVLEDAL